MRIAGSYRLMFHFKIDFQNRIELFTNLAKEWKVSILRTMVENVSLYSSAYKRRWRIAAISIKEWTTLALEPE